jgi:hypothetical protein
MDDNVYDLFARGDAHEMHLGDHMAGTAKVPVVGDLTRVG